MAIIVNSIGLALRDYSTIAAWAAALPANLVTDGNSYVGECYKDAEFFSNSSYVAYINGNTTDATHTITLTTGAGQGFRDNASAQTNELKYNAANGVALNSSADAALYVGSSYVTVSNLQLKSTSGTRPALRCYAGGSSSGANATVDGCLLSSNGGASYAVLILGTTAKVTNTVVIAEASTPAGAIYWDGGQGGGAGNTLAFLTVVLPNGVTATSSYGLSLVGVTTTTVLENIALFGFENVLYDPNVASVSTTCMTNLTGFTGWAGSKLYVNQFEGITDGAQDWRQKAAADLNGAGTADAVNGPFDIVGTARPQGTDWDIGAWELVDVPGGFVIWPISI